MMTRLLIIADDLTGANDTGVQFVRLGISTLVSISPETPIIEFAEKCDVLVVNTESRHVSSLEAFELVFKIAQQGIALEIPKFYKKTDSTLRGNIGIELEALLAATNEHALFFAPAFPKMKRISKEGKLFVDGVPLHQTSMADDLLNPISDSYIPNILARQTKTEVEIFDEKIQASSEPKIYILDAERDEELQLLANRIAPSEKVLAGSAGWAACLPQALHFKTIEILPERLDAPMVIVNGSLHEVSLQQISFAGAQGLPVVNINSENVVASVLQKFAASTKVILTTDRTSENLCAAEKLAECVRQILERLEVKTLVVFGGDTLAAIAQTLHWRAFRPCYEIFDGIPVVKICEDERFNLVTKAGAFGAEDLLMKL